MHTKTKALRRNYDQLEDLERLRLAVAALARGDDDESKAIRDTAPQATYKMMAWPYRGMLVGVFHATWAAITNIMNSALQMTLLPCLDTMRRERGQEPDPERDHDRRLASVKAAKGIISAWEGLDLFCQELGITREQALAQAPTMHLLETVVTLAEMILDADACFAHYLSEQIASAGKPEEGDRVWAEWEKRTEREQAEAARRAADVMLELWRRDAGLDNEN